MLNVESVDRIPTKAELKGFVKECVEILFTDNNGDECLRIQLEVSDARRLASMILKRTKWDK